MQPKASALGFPTLGLKLKCDIIIRIEIWNNFVFKKQNWLHVNGLWSRGWKGEMFYLIRPRAKLPHAMSHFSSTWGWESMVNFNSTLIGETFMWITYLPICVNIRHLTPHLKCWCQESLQDSSFPMPERAQKTQILCHDLLIMLNHYFWLDGSFMSLWLFSRM